MQTSNQPIRLQQQKAWTHADVVREVQLIFRLNGGMGKKSDLSDFHRGMIVGARKGGLSISRNSWSSGIFLYNSL